MPDNVVSLVGFDGPDSVKEAIERCDGFAGLKPGACVLVKPNLVAWDNLGPFPPWGVLTTSTVMEGLCRALKDAGAGEIIIGEGSVVCDPVGSSTSVIYEKLGYSKLAERYGAKLVDFNEGEHVEVKTAEGLKLKVTDRVEKYDFFINVPVLKTHVETVVSLGMKNLKGLLHRKSKRRCHNPEELIDNYICFLADRFPPSLTIIDGVYNLERGPLHFGRARRRNLLIASTDAYAADLLGAYVLGYGTEEVEHLNQWAESKGRQREVEKLEVRTAGEWRDWSKRKNESEKESAGAEPDLEKARRRLPYDWEWMPDNSYPELYEKIGVKGVILPQYDRTLCTGCSFMYIPLMVTLMSAEQKEFEGYEFLTGKMMRPTGRAKKTFLLGKCQVKLNKDNQACKEIIRIKSCPTSINDLFQAFEEHGVPVSLGIYDQYRRDLMQRYISKPDLFPLEDFYLDASA